MKKGWENIENGDFIKDAMFQFKSKTNNILSRVYEKTGIQKFTQRFRFKIIHI